MTALPRGWGSHRRIQVHDRKDSPKAKSKTPRKDDPKAKVDQAEPDVKVSPKSKAPVPAVRPVTRSSTRVPLVAGKAPNPKADPLDADVKKWMCPVCTIVLQDYTSLLDASDSSTFECSCCGTLLEVNSEKKFSFVVVEENIRPGTSIIRYTGVFQHPLAKIDNLTNLIVCFDL